MSLQFRDKAAPLSAESAHRKNEASKMHCAQSHSDELFIQLMIQLGEHFSFSGVKFHAS